MAMDPLCPGLSCSNLDFSDWVVWLEKTSNPRLGIFRCKLGIILMVLSESFGPRHYCQMWIGIEVCAVRRNAYE